MEISKVATEAHCRQAIVVFHFFQAIHKSLQQLIKAVKGEIVMSLDLEEAYYAILNHKVPKQWKVSR